MIIGLVCFFIEYCVIVFVPQPYTVYFILLWLVTI